MYFVEIAVNQGFENPSSNPFIGPSLCTLQRMQARYTFAIVNHRQANFQLLKFDSHHYKSISKCLQVWRLITPIFLHAGVVDLVINVFFQVPLEAHNPSQLATFSVQPTLGCCCNNATNPRYNYRARSTLYSALMPSGSLYYHSERISIAS